MPEFNLPVDIANRALQRVGAELITAFTDNNNRAAAVNFNYGKLRQAELERNIWTFSTRRAAIRPLDTDSMILQPTLWSSNVTYFVGSIVNDANNTAWKSILRDNLGNQPGVNLSAWVPYFGPMSAERFDSSKGYFAGELIYTLSGAGTFNIYESLISGNTAHPGLPNQWRADTIYKKDDVVNVFPNWSSLTTYTQGQTVLYTDGNIYSSLTNSNLNNIPPSSGTNWQLMPTLVLMSQQMPTNQFAPPVLGITTPIDEWSADLNYVVGNFVMFVGNIYLCILAVTGGVTGAGGSVTFPNAAGSTNWVQCTGGTAWQSLIDLNMGNSPASVPANWSAVTTYATGNTVAATDGIIYTSLQNSNINHNPANGANPTWWSAGALVPWTTSFTLGGGNSLWIQIGGSGFSNGVAIAPLQVTYPAGSGPLSQSWTKNVYRLPAGHLRKAPQDPKAGINSWLGAPGNLVAKDWTFEGDLLISWDSACIVYRFIADVQDVTKFKAQFCEALSCRIALEICEPLTQSTAKKQVAAQEYRKFLTEAITIDQIETGAVEPALDDLIATRL